MVNGTGTDGVLEAVALRAAAADNKVIILKQYVSSTVHTWVVLGLPCARQQEEGIRVDRQDGL